MMRFRPVSVLLAHIVVSAAPLRMLLFVQEPQIVSLQQIIAFFLFRKRAPLWTGNTTTPTGEDIKAEKNIKSHLWWARSVRVSEKPIELESNAENGSTHFVMLMGQNVRNSYHLSQVCVHHRARLLQHF